MRIWTNAYRPMLMGGDVNTPIATEVDALGPYDLGAGFRGYVVVSPKEGMFVVEESSGGIVGSSLATVRSDIADADVSVLKAQVEVEIQRGKTATMVSVDVFWRMMRQNV